MQILHFLENPSFASLDIQKLLETENSKEIRICMPKGKEMREHQAPGAIVVRVLQGRIWFEVQGAKHTLERGDCIALEAHVPHSLGGLEDSVLNLTLSKLDSVQRVLDVASNK
ncbi:Cupin domain-containing protein [Helicobacter sp. NHP19-012]|uniref:Cupin domain-containing protein n=1 Tax=Helicobacter gastrofelis TaxID=2849642 RepID=A0ABM7SP93_9HELI|nr:MULTISPECIES: cupin domain-containing protein [unclassified Helicobacter]BCZ19426.1 Cupin domain-containing protein [Helicobacter sp. NHP19-012]GMB96417.1 Cupin domain-containing protein [Helicobacter sp. NHP22-001]